MAGNSTKRLCQDRPAEDAGRAGCNSHCHGSARVGEGQPPRCYLVLPHLPHPYSSGLTRWFPSLIPKNPKLPQRTISTHFKGGNGGLTHTARGQGRRGRRVSEPGALNCMDGLPRWRAPLGSPTTVGMGRGTPSCRQSGEALALPWTPLMTPSVSP